MTDDELDALAEEDPAAAFEQGAGIPGTHLRAAEYWDEMIADMEATAGEYEAEGWETVQLHPGDVTTRVPDEDSEMFGLDVLVPDNEFEVVEELVNGGATFDAYEVFRATADGLVLFVVAMEDHDEAVAVLYPAYYDAQNDAEMLAAAKQAGEMRTYIRTLQMDRVEFTHEEPANFAPPTDEDEE
jgi:hypothetical protein